MEIAYRALGKHLHEYDGLHATLTASGTSRRTLLKIHFEKVNWAIGQMKNKISILKDAVADPLASIKASYLHLTLSVIKKVALLT
jgi:hypothetical protein